MLLNQHLEDDETRLTRMIEAAKKSIDSQRSKGWVADVHTIRQTLRTACGCLDPYHQPCHESMEHYLKREALTDLALEQLKDY